MQITETSAEGLTRKYQVVVGADDIQGRVDRRLSEIAKTIRISGFRPGKVPVSVVKQRYGQSILGEILEQAVNETSAETIKEKDLRPALQPKIEISTFGEGKDLVYDMQLEVLPHVDLPDLKALKLERLKPEISDEEIDESLKKLSERYRKSEPVADGSGAVLGDVAVIDFVGSIDGEEFSGGSSKAHSLELGSGRFIPGFEEQLVGATAGSHHSVKVTFPEEYGAAHLSGKEAVFEVDVTEIQRKLPALIDDSLAETLGVENLEELRKEVRDQIVADYEQMGRQKLKRDLLDAFAEQHSFEVPAGMVDIEFDSIWRQFETEKENAEKAGTYKPEEGKTEDDIKAEYRLIAERRVRLGLLLAEIGKNANIQVAQDEVNRAVVAQARQYPGQEKVIFDYYKSNPDALQALRAPIYEDKVVDHVFAEAEVSEKLLPTKEFVAAAQMDDDDEAPAGDTPVDEPPAEAAT